MVQQSLTTTDRERLAASIEHTLLAANATAAQIERLCDDAARCNFAGVCVNPVYVPLAARRLRGTSVRVVSVVGFPLGASRTTIKAAEARTAVTEGASEVDMVLHVGGLLSGCFDDVRNDIAAVVHAAHGGLVKVIIETALLTDDQKRRACELCVEAGAHFVKTSTGFAATGATVADVGLMRSVVGHAARIKAAGGIRSAAFAMALIAAGADRIGTSAGPALLAELENAPLT